jgi:hypothetical protein
LNRLRRKAYRDTAAATGSSGGGAALALWRAVTRKGYRAWCYEFGFAGAISQTVTVVETDGVLQVHDAFFNLTYSLGFHDVLDALRDGRPAAAKSETRDRKIYLSDPAFEPEASARWLEANADRELVPTDGLRRFELLWTVEAFIATSPRIEAAYRELEERGYPRDLRFLMLHPIEMFDGEKSHRDPGTMPLLAGRDLVSLLAVSRATAKRMSHELASERERGTERDAAILRLEGERDVAQSAEASVSAEARRLGDQIVQLRAALDDETRRFAAERRTLAQDKDRLEDLLRQQQDALSKAETEVAALRAEMLEVRTGWNEERRRAECAAASLRAETGLWIEQSSQAMRTMRLALNNAESERLQAMADRDRIAADLAVRLHAWEHSPGRRIRAFFMRALGKPMMSSSTAERK